MTSAEIKLTEHWCNGNMDIEFWNKSYRDDPAQTAVKDFFIAAEAADLAPGSALDMGCGTGDIALALAAQGWDVTGVDFAAEAIELARKAAQDRGLSATFVTADATTWQAPRQYDLVISTFAMPAGAGMASVVAAMSAALNPGGTLLISEWDPKMRAIWGFGEDELHSAAAYAAAMPQLRIETVETRHVSNPFAQEDSSGQGADVLFIRAVKPKQ